MSNQDLGRDTDALAKELVEELELEAPEGSFSNPVVGAVQVLDAFSKEIAHGLHCIYNNIPLAVEKAGLKLSPVCPLNDLIAAFSSVSEEKSYERLADVAGLSDEALAIMYQSAIRVLEHQGGADGMAAMRVLTALEPRVGLFWLSYGEACMRAERPELAMDAFRTATLVNPLLPGGYIRTFQVALETGQQAVAHEILEIAKEVIESEEGAQDLKRDIDKLLLLLEEL